VSGDEPSESTGSSHWIRTVVMAVGGLAAVVIIFLRIGDPAELWETLQHATWGWLVLALVVSLLTSESFLYRVPAR
jgi:uncharacterized membrane protein YbhN (UPF0104 family)